MGQTCYQCVFLFLLIVNLALGYKVVLENLSDFDSYNFKCTNNIGNMTCSIKEISSAVDLPAYFPLSYRQLSGDKIWYIEPTLPQDPNYVFEVTTTSLQLEGKLMTFTAEYYAEEIEMIYYGAWGGDQQFSPFNGEPSRNSIWNVSESVYQDTSSFHGRLGFQFKNDRSSKFVVFRKLEIEIGLIPKIHISINSLEDFNNERMNCSGTAGCVMKTVSNAMDLPEYFPSNFTNLETNSTENIMWAEQLETEYFSRMYMLTKFEEELNFRCGLWMEGGLFYTAEFAMQGNNFGFSPGSWSISPGRLGEWKTFTSNRVKLNDFLCDLNGTDNQMGFYIFNNQLDVFTVFKRLEIEIYYTDDAVKPTPTTTPSTTTSVTTTTQVSESTTFSTTITTDTIISSTTEKGSSSTTTRGSASNVYLQYVCQLLTVLSVLLAVALL